MYLAVDGGRKLRMECGVRILSPGLDPIIFCKVQVFENVLDSMVMNRMRAITVLSTPYDGV